MSKTYQLPDTTAGILVAVKLANKELAKHGLLPLTQAQEEALRSDPEAFAVVDEIEKILPFYPIGEIRALVVEAHMVAQRELTVYEVEAICGYI